MNDVIALLVESFERLDTAARDFEQGVGSYERLQARRDAVFAQIDAAKAVLAERDAELARLRAEREQAFLLLDAYQQERERTGAIPDDDEVDQAIAILRDRETADAAPQTPTCHMCSKPTALRQDLDLLRVYGCDACDTEYCRRKG